MRYHRILVPVDGSATSNAALAMALETAGENGGRVLLVHALDPFVYVTGFEASAEVINAVLEGAKRILEEAEQVAKAAGVPCESHFVDAPAKPLGEVIAGEARAWEADLIVVGTHGRRGVSRLLLGSGAEQIIRLAPVAVLVIRGRDEA